VGRQVVDELVVALRLDDSQFDRAVADAIAARQKLADETDKAAKKEGNSLGAVAGRYLKWAAVLTLMKKVSDEVVKVADGLLDLSTESRRLGMSASGLRTWQNAIEMLGGKAGEATSEVGKFMESLNALVYKGDVGENLQWLARLGVPVRRGMTYEETAPQVFSAIKKGRASGTIKDDQEAAFIARQAGFGIVGDYIAQRPTATQDDFRGFIGLARSRAIDEGNAAAGAQAMRSVIQAGQKLQQTKEGIVGRQEGKISAIAEAAGATKEFAWEIGEGVVNVGTAVINVAKKAAAGSSVGDGKSGVVVHYPYSDTGFASAPYYTDSVTGKEIPADEAKRRMKESRERDAREKESARSGKIIRNGESSPSPAGVTPRAGANFRDSTDRRGGTEPRPSPSLPVVAVPPPTPNVQNDNSRSSNVTINQTNNIRSTDPVSAGREVAGRTRKEIVGLSDGAAR
jgi:hypothetical protein